MQYLEGLKGAQHAIESRSDVYNDLTRIEIETIVRVKVKPFITTKTVEYWNGFIDGLIHFIFYGKK